MRGSGRLLKRFLQAVAMWASATAACASGDPLGEVLRDRNGAALGAGWRLAQSPYRGGGTRFDLVPLYLYESSFLYLHAYRLGLKWRESSPGRRFDLFIEHRFEGFPYDRIPESLDGMEGRDPGFDLGIGIEQPLGSGRVFLEAMHDAARESHGSELRLGYRALWRFPRLTLQPGFTLFARDRRLNDYYYGVRTGEVRPGRPAYTAGAGVNMQVSLDAVYQLTDRWRLIGGVAATRWSESVRNSPITALEIASWSGFLGAAYDFTPEKKDWNDGAPLLVRAYYGRSADCHLVQIMRLSCIDAADDGTTVASVELGRVLLVQANGWPLDFNGYVGILRHDENGLQRDSWQVNAYIKALYYGFPWRDVVRTRVGFGVGVSFAENIPFVEARDQARRQRNSSKLLNYLDPSIDINVGDLLRVRSLRDTWWGFGVSHRSGIFGNSQLLGNVNGGSNYIYTFVETKL